MGSNTALILSMLIMLVGSFALANLYAIAV